MLEGTSQYRFSQKYRKDGVVFYGIRPRIVILPSSNDIFHTVTEGERIELIAWKYYQDVRLFWVLCDVNLIRDPLRLEKGVRLRIPPKSEVLKVVK